MGEIPRQEEQPQETQENKIEKYMDAYLESIFSGEETKDIQEKLERINGAIAMSEAYPEAKGNRKVKLDGKIVSFKSAAEEKFFAEAELKRREG